MTSKTVVANARYKQWRIQDFPFGGGGAEPLWGVLTSDVGAFWQKHM